MNNKKLKMVFTMQPLVLSGVSVLGTLFFQYISYAGAIEVVIHRSLWTFVILLITTLYLNKWKIFKKILFNKKNLIYLFFTSFLIFANWATWIFAVSTQRIIDASYGYFIFPILNIFFGYLFLNESLNKKRIISVIIVIISSIYLLLNFLHFLVNSLLLYRSIYNLLRKKLMSKLILDYLLKV